MNQDIDNYNFSKSTPGGLIGKYPFADEACCDRWKELCITREINISLPVYKDDKSYLYYINTNGFSNGNRWHRVAFCPFCGSSKGKEPIANRL